MNDLTPTDLNLADAVDTELISLMDIAGITNLPLRRLRLLVQDGTLPPVNRGARTHLFTAGAMCQLLEERPTLTL